MTPVSVATGFLGSGKTTLISRLLRGPTLADTAMIVNAFGAAGGNPAGRDRAMHRVTPP